MERLVQCIRLGQANRFSLSKIVTVIENVNFYGWLVAFRKADVPKKGGSD